MANEAKKRPSLEEFFGGFSKPIQREEYVTVQTEDGKVASKSNTAKRVYDPKTKKTEVDNAPIGVVAPLETKQVEAPVAPPVVEAPKAPEGPYIPMDAQAQAPVQSLPKQQVDPQPADTGSVWERLLIGATPLLTGLLTGNSLEGVQVSGNYFATEEADRYKRGKDFNSKLAEMKAKRDMAGTLDNKSHFNKAEVLNPQTGKVEIWSTLNGKRHEFLGLKAADSKSPKASYQRMVEGNGKVGLYEVLPGQNPRRLGDAEDKFAPQYDFLDVEDDGTKDPFDAKKIVYKNGEYQGDAGRLAPKAANLREDGKDRRFEEAQMNSIVKDFRNKNSKFSLAQEDAANIAKAAEMINKPNAFSDEGVKTFLSRSVFGEKGPLSDYDLARLAGEGSIDESMMRKIQGWRNGNKITDTDAKAMYDVLQRVYPYIKRKAMGELEGTIKAYPKYAGELAPRLRAYVEGNFADLPAWANPKRNNVDVSVNVNKNMAAPAGFRVFRNAQGLRATIPSKDTKAIQEAIEDGFQEIK